MSDQWMSVQAAAAALGMDEASVRRQIAEDKLAIRPGENGLEVLVTAPTAPAVAAAPTAEPPAEAPQPVTRGTVFEAMLAAEAEEQESAHIAAAPSAPVSSRFGRYAPLSHAEVGTPIDPNEKPFRSPLIPKPAPAAEASGGEKSTSSSEKSEAFPGDEITRFQRLAGASLVLAQQRADDAREQIAFARAEAHRLRKLNRFSLAGTATAIVLGVVLVTSYAADASRAEGALRAQMEQIEQARADADHARGGEMVMKRENATLAERLTRAETDRLAAQQQLEEQRARLTQFEVEKRHAETALKAALVSLYQYQPEEARSAVDRLRAEVTVE